MIKRSLDIMLVLGTFPIWIFILLIIAILVKINMGSPVFFQQLRGGMNGNPFRLIKFRTMTDKRDENGQILPDHDRLTRFGIWLRSTSLDELPELLNILKGDMSLVGPRPLPLKYIERYSNTQRRRLEIKPGLTGWAQIQGRNALTWEKRFQLDVWYVKNQTFWLDIKIMCLTPWIVIKRDGINAGGEATMPEFMGDDKKSEIC